jgi:hypothetical protein
VRGDFNDPRFGHVAGFHFGIDISAPNGGPRSLSVADGDLDFGYWHVTPP